ncbi:MAG: hypothetical protein ACOY3I_01625 [Verrucomicrobiota bacterium]
MTKARFFLGVGLVLTTWIFSAQAMPAPAVQMAESSAVEQNRFYPIWKEGGTLSEVYYGVPVEFYRPSHEQQRKWWNVARMFLKDLIEQQQGAQARIFAPEGLIHPAVLRDGREFFRIFWKDKTHNERHVTDDIDIVAMGDAGKWMEIWVRFVEEDRDPSIQHTNYAAMLIEETQNNEPYLADFKMLGRTSTCKENEEHMQGIIGLRKFALKPEAKSKKEKQHPRLR